jgi:hypothetical protein
LLRSSWSGKGGGGILILVRKSNFFFLTSFYFKLQPKLNREGGERAVIERVVIERAVIERAVIERAVIERAVIERHSTNNLCFGAPRPAAKSAITPGETLRQIALSIHGALGSNVLIIDTRCSKKQYTVLLLRRFPK